MKLEHQEAYLEEWDKMLGTLRVTNKDVSRLDYFLELGKQYANISSKKPKLIMLGLEFPEEILLSLEQLPVYVLGGSFISASWAEQMVPRDTDSVIKSILGMLMNDQWNITEDAAVLIPVTCDSMRKIAYGLSEKMKVIPVEMPSDKSNPNLQKQWREEIENVISRIEKHSKKHLTNRKMKEQIRAIGQAKEAWRKLEKYVRKQEVSLSGSLILYLANSYFYTADKAEWARNLMKLLREEKHKKIHIENKQNPQVLLLGSPIYAPNYKIPFLLEELGLDLSGFVHPMVNHLSAKTAELTGKERKGALIDYLAKETLERNMSPSFVENTVLSARAEECMQRQQFDGVVFHVLKGQIEYDFELSRLEQRFEEQNIPVFRLETDYNYQDIEQLRIRLEAFAEMLAHRLEVLRRGA